MRSLGLVPAGLCERFEHRVVEALASARCSPKTKPEQVLAVVIASERARLTYQRPKRFAVVDAVIRIATQTLHDFDGLVAEAHLDDL